VAVGVSVAVAAASAGGWFGRAEGDDRRRPWADGNTPYDGRFVFIRLSYPMGLGRFDAFVPGGRDLPWAHDYPRADVHLMKILEELTLLAPRMDGSNILSLDDPELFNFPFAYMSEPGFWRPSDKEIEGLRAYLAKGGFILFDDFRRDPDWYNLQQQMRRVLPERRFIEIDSTHPVFHSFFEIDRPQDFIPPYGDEPPAFYGLFEDDDPGKRLMAVANVNNDLGEYWEFSDTGWVPIDLSNEAYKFGVNYVVYAMTH
jgi:hypothetical protein